MITGIDIVKQMIRVASGEPLGIRQRDVRITGHAIECRINAEDPEKNFMPCAGRITRFDTPGGPGVRLDTHAAAGYTVPPNYDSMIGKLIVHAEDRRASSGCRARSASSTSSRSRRPSGCTGS
jgi:acetyl-CoA carboxylase biotin carboxylase subunit